MSRSSHKSSTCRQPTFEVYWKATETSRDEAFGHLEMVIPLYKAPFCAALISPGIHHCMDCVHGGNAVADIVTFGHIAGTNTAAYAKTVR